MSDFDVYDEPPPEALENTTWSDGRGHTIRVLTQAGRAEYNGTSMRVIGRLYEAELNGQSVLVTTNGLTRTGYKQVEA